MGVCCQHHALAALYPRERTPGIRWIQAWVGLRAGLDTEDRGKILCLCRGWSPGRPVCSPTLYSLNIKYKADVLACMRGTLTELAYPPRTKSSGNLLDHTRAMHWGLKLFSVSEEFWVSSRQKVRTDYDPALCTHRPSPASTYWLGT
jgi:hypothetical protein